MPHYILRLSASLALGILALGWSPAAAQEPAQSPASSVLDLPGKNVQPLAAEGRSAAETTEAYHRGDSIKSGAAHGSPYKPLFYDNDFSYLDSPDFVSCDPLDCLKRISLAPCTTLDTGGEYRLRFHEEQNLRLTGRNNDFLLQRTRLYGDLHYAGWLRGYAEFLDATSAFEELTPRVIEENRADFINLFGEAKLWDGQSGSLSARVGRQELLYGSQRLVSPLDWSNTRRTFDGAKLFWKGTAWDVDGFWTRPVPFGQHVNDDHNFDSPDQSQQFFGTFATWHGLKDHTWDLYYLALEEDDLRNPAGKRLGRFDAFTFGTRYQGRCQDWLWEAEGGYQFGDYRTQDQSAGFYTLGAGYDFNDLPWKPVLWAYFDWASGDSDPTDGDHGTFNQLFPLVHRYLGFADLVARQNIEDWNFLLTAKPHDRVSLLVWWHIFHLQQARDSLYNGLAVPIRTDLTGAAGTDVGQELDITVQVELGPHADVLLGYTRFFAGDFLANTGNGDDANFYYAQFSFRF